MFWEKFYNLCLIAGVAPNSVAKELSIASGTVSEWKKGRTPNNATLKKIATYFNVTIEYLRGESSPPGNTHPLAQDGVHLAPLFENVSAGFGSFAESQVIDHIPIYVTKKAEAEQTICIRVRGDSMAPVICDGDIVQVRKQDSVISGSVAVVMVEDEGFVKSVYYEEGKWLELRSENPDYPPMRFEGSSIDKVRVVGFVTKVISDVNRHITEPDKTDESKQRLNDLLNGLDEKQLEQLLAVANLLIDQKKNK
jgi:repressor LexA